MYPKFYYFLKRTSDGIKLPSPIETEDFLGDIGDFVEINGRGYIVLDYAVEVVDEKSFEDNIDEDCWR